MYISFENPIFLWFLLLIPLLVLLHFYSLHYVRQRAMRFANFEALEKILQAKQVIPNNYLLLIMRVFTLIAFTIAASGITFHYETTASAFDYVVAVDSSNSMLATDLSPTRMGAATSALSGWLSSMQPGSKVGLVQFSSQATVLLPLTSDLIAASRDTLSIVPDRSGGTAICEAIKASANQFGTGDSQNAIVLLSDGQNNAGCLLEEGIGYAKAKGIRVFAITIGSKAGGSIEGLDGVVFIPEEGDLRSVAQQTGGTYFRAENAAQLSDALTAILQPSQRAQSILLSVPIMMLAFLLVFVDWGMSITRYRTIP